MKLNLPYGEFLMDKIKAINSIQDIDSGAVYGNNKSDKNLVAISSKLNLIWIDNLPHPMHHDQRVELAEEQLRRWSKYLQNAMCDFGVDDA